MVTKPIVDYFQMVCDATIMHVIRNNEEQTFRKVEAQNHGSKANCYGRRVVYTIFIQRLSMDTPRGFVWGDKI